MKQLLFLLPLCAICVSCVTTKKAQATIPSVSEISTTKVVIRKSFIHDTVYLEIPAQQAERTTKDSTSNLETDYAVSTARINRDGTLYHNLLNKPQKQPVSHETPVLTKDSVVYMNRTIHVPYPIEKKLTKWEALSIEYFKFLLPILALAICCIFRKPILALIRRLI